MGTPVFASVILRHMVEAGLIPYVAVTQEDKPTGRGRILKPGPVKSAALEFGIEVWQPAIINAEWRQKISESKPDVIAVAAFGKILRPSVLSIPRLGCVNAHASLLPRHRGASPVAHAILAGDEMTGVTIMMMDQGIDTGDILLTAQIPIQPDDTTVTLTQKLAELSGPLMVETLRLLDQGKCPRTPQDHSKATYAPILTKQDGQLDFTQPAAIQERKVRAMWPWPGAYTCLRGRMLRVHEAKLLPDMHGEPGTILDIRPDGILVACSVGGLLLTQVQAEGKSIISASDFVRGARLLPGEKCTLL